MDSFNKKYITANNQVIEYFCSDPKGGATPTVFIHGWGSRAELWFDVAKTFVEKKQFVYMINLPGFGGSENPHHDFTVGDYANTLVDFIKKLDLKEVVLVGHSFGGRVALRTAKILPDTVSKLVLVDSSGIRTNKKRVLFLEKIAHIFRPLFRPLFMSSVKAKIYSSIGAKDYTLTPSLKQTFVNIINEEDTSLYSHIKQETLIVWGEDDDITPLSSAKIMEKEIPHASLVVLPGAGHFSFLDQKDLFTQKATSFIV